MASWWLISHNILKNDRGYIRNLKTFLIKKIGLTPLQKSMKKGLGNTLKLFRNVFDVYLFRVSSLNSSLRNQKLANKIFRYKTTHNQKTGATMPEFIFATLFDFFL